MVEALGLVVGARHVERHAVFEDDPVAVARLQGRHRLVVGQLQRVAGLGALLHHLVEVAQKSLRSGNAFLDRPRADQRVASPGHQRLGLEVAKLLQSLRPVLVVGVAAIGGGAVLDEIAAEQRALLGQPDDRIALGMAAAGMDDVDLQLAQPQGHAVAEGDGGPGQPWNGLSCLEEARKALQLGLVVLCATLDDHVARGLAANDVLGTVAAGTQHAHGVIVREHHVLDGLVGNGADALDNLLRHLRRRLGVDHHHRVVADHDARVGIALRREGVCMFGKTAEGDLLVRHIRL